MITKIQRLKVVPVSAKNDGTLIFFIKLKCVFSCCIFQQIAQSRAFHQTTIRYNNMHTTLIVTEQQTMLLKTVFGRQKLKE